MVEELGFEGTAVTPAPDDVDWLAVREDHEGGVGTLAEMAARYGVTENQIRHRRETEGWMRRRAGKVNPIRLLDRMLFVLDCQIREMELRMRKAKDNAGGERDAALLANMAKTLEKLLELKAGQSGGNTVTQKKPIDIEELRERLAKRIDEISRS